MTGTITVYSREDCPLCAEAIATIERIVAELDVSVDLTVVDVGDDPELAAEYGDRVPYVFVDGNPEFEFHVDAEELRELLE